MMKNEAFARFLVL